MDSENIIKEEEEESTTMTFSPSGGIQEKLAQGASAVDKLDVNAGQTMDQRGSNTENVKTVTPMHKIKYPVCTKGNFHDGELLNYVYLSTTNKDDVLGCAICQEENKKGQWRPLKVVLHQALENSIKQSKSEFNFDEILQYLEQQSLVAEKQLDELLTSFTEKITVIKQSTLSYFMKMKDQVLSHTSSNNAINDLFNNVFEFQNDIDLLKSSVQRLINFIPSQDDEEEETQFESKAIKTNIESSYQVIQSVLEKGKKDIDDLLENQRKLLEDQILSASIMGKNRMKFQFSNQFKHSQISLMSKNIVKAQGTTPSYRFAIMEPALPKSKPVTLAFKIKQGSTNNWLAVGICHKNIIIQKNYGFQFSALGHGAYMISSNAGTWSTTQSASNNVVKAFSFGKNDIIIIDYDPVQKTVKFTKEKSPEQTYKLDFTQIENDSLHACVLFYYVNDEIEYIHNYQSFTTQSIQPSQEPITNDNVS